MANPKSRRQVPQDIQVRVFFRDGWLCHWCHRPTVFGLALKYMEQFLKEQGYEHQTAYYSFRWRRDTSPLLDHLAAVIDHAEAYSTGGAHSVENFVTTCNKCNMRKSNRPVEAMAKNEFGTPVKGRFGEPRYWDGLASMFLVLAGKNPVALTRTERKWYDALKRFFAEKSGGTSTTTAAD